MLQHPDMHQQAPQAHLSALTLLNVPHAAPLHASTTVGAVQTCKLPCNADGPAANKVSSPCHVRDCSGEVVVAEVSALQLWQRP